MMMNLLEVVVQVENRGRIPIYLQEIFLHTLPGRYGLVITVEPFSTKVIAAHTFFARNKSFGRPSTVEVHINGKLIQRLTLQTFVHFPKIIVDGFTDGKGSIIRVIHPQRAFEDEHLNFSPGFTPGEQDPEQRPQQFGRYQNWIILGFQLSCNGVEREEGGVGYEEVRTWSDAGILRPRLS